MFAVLILAQIVFVFCAGWSGRAAAQPRAQGSSKRRGKIWGKTNNGELILPRFLPPALGSTLMTRGCFGAARLAVARPARVRVCEYDHHVHLCTHIHETHVFHTPVA